MGRFGKSRLVTPDRATVCDLLHAARGIPFIPVAKTLCVPGLDALRQQFQPKIAWAVLLMKAYSIVATRWPQLRQVYVRRPWPHIYEHKDNVCQLAVSRQHEGKDRLFFARFSSPEAFSLIELQRQLTALREEPVDSIKQFQRQLRISRLPWFIRRVLWFIRSLSGSRCVHYTGTFGISLSRVLGAELGFHIAPVTGVLGCDASPDNPDELHTTLTFDHRIIDAWPIGNILNELEETLNGQIRSELEMLAAQAPSSEAAA